VSAVIPTCSKRSLTVTGVSFEFYTCYVSITVRAHNEDVTLSKPLNNGDCYETHVAYPLALIPLHCRSSSKLLTKTHQMHHTGMWKRKLEAVLFLWKRKREKHTASPST